MRLSPLKELLLGVLLWLPLCFFLWFYLASPIVFPVSWLTGLVLEGLLPELVLEVKQFGFMVEVTTRLAADVEAGVRGMPVVALDINPMIYGYGLPLFVGLTLATPMSMRRRALHLLVGYLVLIPVQAWGVSWEALKIVALELGPQGTEAVREAGLNLNLVALCYQFGYLILPAVAPVVLWVLGNRPFLESLLRGPAGTVGPGEGQGKG